MKAATWPAPAFELGCQFCCLSFMYSEAAYRTKHRRFANGFANCQVRTVWKLQLPTLVSGSENASGPIKTSEHGLCNCDSSAAGSDALRRIRSMKSMKGIISHHVFYVWWPRWLYLLRVSAVRKRTKSNPKTNQQERKTLSSVDSIWGESGKFGYKVMHGVIPVFCLSFASCWNDWFQCLVSDPG